MAEGRAPGQWLRDTLVPWWREHVVDPHGGYFEAVSAGGGAISSRRRTTLTQARLVYVFSHAAWLHADRSSMQAAMHGRDFLESRCRNRANGGWFRAVDVDGRVLDAVHDTYDQAFVLFALAWHFRATGDSTCRTLAYDTRAFLAANVADATHGGFAEEFGVGPVPPPSLRRQNPHMHLLEAFLAWHAVDETGPWLADAAAIVDLFAWRFVDPRQGSLVEYFARDWTPAPGPKGQWREPGHHFEWVWLLLQYRRYAADPRLAECANRLWWFADRHGIEREIAPRGLAFDGVTADGTLAADTKLLWPQAEYIKACAARAEVHHDRSALALGSSAYASMLACYFDTDGVRWVNQLARNGQVTQNEAPARILYHVFLAIAELARVTPAG